MGVLQFQPDLLDQVAHRLTLREPNRKAIESVLLRTSDHYDVQEKAEPYECIVDSATGVGKTYVMAGLMEYLAGAETPARNFLLLAPGRTIRDKSVLELHCGQSEVAATHASIRPVRHYGRQLRHTGHQNRDRRPDGHEALHLHRSGTDLCHGRRSRYARTPGEPGHVLLRLSLAAR